MRKIKYRQWIGGEFVYWGIEHDGSFTGPRANSNGENAGNTIHQQSTDLKDKNGRTIYEGDILAMSDHPTVPKGEVHFRAGAFRLKRFVPVGASWLNDANLHSYIKRHIVIGNIYQNPELNI